MGQDLIGRQLEGSSPAIASSTWHAAIGTQRALLGLLGLSFVTGLLIAIAAPVAAAGQDPSTLPETMTHDNVIEFLWTNDITTVESFIQALPPLHKRHFITVFESASPGRRFIAADHPRVVSWGADAAFIVTWTTHPDAPGNDSVEFLEAQPGGSWGAGVIDFSGDSPRLRFPGSCASCHGEPARPLWGATPVHEGTEEPWSSDRQQRPLTDARLALYETMATTTHPRLEPLEREGYFTTHRKLSLPGDTLSPNWEFSGVLVARHAEVLFSRLKSQRGPAEYRRFVESRVCDSVPAIPSDFGRAPDLAGVLVDLFSREQFNLALRADTLEPIQGFNPRSRYLGDEYWGGYHAKLSRFILFLTMHDMMRRVGAVASLYRRTPVEEAVISNVARFLLRFPVGEATLEQELIAAYDEFFVSRGQRSLDARALRPMGPIYGQEFILAHTETFTAQFCEVLRADRSPMAVGNLPRLTLESGTSALPVEVSGAFADPDGDALTYGATSSAATVAAVAVSGSTVTVTPLSVGSATVTVTATDVNGSNTSATQRFAVSVAGGGGGGGGGVGGGRNRGPAAVGTLSDRTLEPAEVLSVDVAPSFRDRDGDVLTYAAESSSAGVASASVASAAASGVVTVTALSVGEAVVTVTATDAEGSNRSAAQSFAVMVVHDADADGLITVHTLAQLDAVRHDLDGDGAPAAAGAAGYAAAFGVTTAGTVSVSCGASAGCAGYELGSDLDFDTNGSGGPDAGDAYWHGGAGWLPIGTAAAPFESRFEGNGRRIRGLFVRRGDGAGLFGATGPSSVIRHLGVVAVDVSGANAVGALAGRNGSLVTGSYATGRVSGSGAVGGLVGNNSGSIGGSHAAVQVTGETSAGGLVGINDGRVAAGYATGRVSGTGLVGGLVGLNRGALTAGYATGRVTGDGETGGLVGDTESPGTVTAGYWDTATSGQAAGAAGAADTAGEGRTTSALQAPTDYTGSYASWNVDVDGDGAADVPWDFGTDAEYPALSLDVDGDGRSTWQEVARQLRAGPAVTAAPSADPAQVALTWTAVDGGAWTPPPEVAYTVYREAGAAAETVEAGVRGTRHADRNVEPGRAYTYQVAAVADGGEAVRSAVVEVEVPCAFTVTPLHRDVLWTAGTGQVTVTTGPTCGWTALSESGFLTVTAGAAGTGSGTVTYAVAANGGGPRTGALLVAGERVTVYQASPTAFTDHPIEPGVTPVRGIHFLELRARVDALRAGVGLRAFGWTDAALIPGVTPVKRVHLTELRTALSEAYVASGRSAPAYTDTALAVGTGIRAAHLMELRTAVLGPRR